MCLTFYPSDRAFFCSFLMAAEAAYMWRGHVKVDMTLLTQRTHYLPNNQKCFYHEPNYHPNVFYWRI